MGRTVINVKLGRKLIAPYVPGVAQHWAVKVGGTWYEIAGKSGGEAGKSGPNKVNRNSGYEASSGAGSFGGELVGETSKSDVDINSWIDNWLERNSQYDALSDNCQKFSFELIVWLTEGVYTIPHRFDAAVSQHYHGTIGGFAVAQDGNAIARYGASEVVTSAGPGQLKFRSFEVKAQAVAGPGLGAFADASAARLEASVGNIVGVHYGPNINTGIGVRNGNAEAHLLGFGAKVGADGLEINTPLGGYNACNVM